MAVSAESKVTTRSMSQRLSPIRSNQLPCSISPEMTKQGVQHHDIPEQITPTLHDSTHSPHSSRESRQYIQASAINKDDIGIIRDQMQHVCQAVSTLEGAMSSLHKDMAKQRVELNRRRLRHTQYNESSDTSESEVESLLDNNSFRDRQRTRTLKHLKLPSFTGKESWTVWFNRFQEISNRQGLTPDEKLDEILPRLQGYAGEFVFEQLTPEIRRDYKSLCKELNNRFRIVETTKSYKIQFSGRQQKMSESPEDYAAELKRIYDKAYPRRDRETRREDLLRKFLDGTFDDKARFHVEYVKEPNSIDEAVYEMVCFREMKKSSIENRAKEKYARATTADDEESSAGEDQAVIARAHQSNKNRLIKKNDPNQAKESKNQLSDELEQMKQEIKLLREQLKRSQNGSQLVDKQDQFQASNSRWRRQPTRSRGCFHCNSPTHFIRDCPYRGESNQEYLQQVKESVNDTVKESSLNLKGPAQVA